MTREEALQILDTIPTIGEQVDALEMAISALTLKSPCSLCRFRNEDTGICDMCPAMPYCGAKMESEDKK